MSNTTAEYFEYRIISRLILGTVIVIGMGISACVYEQHLNIKESQVMILNGYTKVYEPCSKDIIWKKETP